MDKALNGLQQGWSKLAMRGLSPDCFVGGGEGGADAAALALAGGSGVASGGEWRGIGILTLAAIPAWLPVTDRLGVRGANRAWWRASEHGPSRQAWVDSLSGSAISATELSSAAGGVVGACHGRYKFMASKAEGTLYKGKPSNRDDLLSINRLKAPEPCVAFWDATAALLLDKAPAVESVPDVVLAVYDMVTCVPVGSISLAKAQHGQTIQRPLSVLSLQAASGGGAFQAQACVAALERLVVVFSWQLGTSGNSESSDFQLQLLGGRVDEVRWGDFKKEGNHKKETLKCASFAGVGPSAPVAVLLDNAREGPWVEIYMRGGGGLGSDPAAYTMREIVPIGLGAPSTPPAQAKLFGNVAVWTVAGVKTVDFVTLPETLAAAAGDGDAAAAGGGGGGAHGGGVAAFARAKKHVKSTKLKLNEEGGAGLDMEATPWGYLVEEVDKDPGQADIKAGDCIISIGGQTLHGLEEEAMEWRFGRSFAEGAEVLILPKEHFQIVQAQDKKGAAAAEVPAVGGPSTRLTQARRHVDMPTRVETWIVAADRTPPRLIVVADNRMLVADLDEDKPFAHDVLSGVIRPPYKRPTTRLALLDGGAGDIIVAGVSKGCLVWRVPALTASLTAKAPAKPELLAQVNLPPNANFLSATVGLSLGAQPVGWMGVEMCGASDTFDVYHWFPGRTKPLPPLPATVRGRTGNATIERGEGDTVAKTLTVCGAAVDAVVGIAKRSATLVPAPKEGRELTVEVLRSWVSQLPDAAGEELYKIINDAEKVLADGVRDLRIWIRTEGKAPTMAAAARADDARGVSKWAENCRRQIIWPLQAAFEEGESAPIDPEPEDHEIEGNTGPRFPLLAAASAAALAAKNAAKAPAQPAPAPTPAPAAQAAAAPAAEAVPTAPLSAAERRARAAAAIEARAAAGPPAAG